MDQRTRERLPVLPALVRTAADELKKAQERLAAVQVADPGTTFTVLGETFTKARGNRWSDPGQMTIAFDTGGKRRRLGDAELRAFWAWASVEFLRLTGVRIEEMLEVSHHSIVQYKLPTTGEIVPLLQIAPSKTDEERLLLVSPELADVLSTIVCRARDESGTIPLVASYDHGERVWNPPMPLLFQWSGGGQNRVVSMSTIRKGLDETLDASGLTDNTGQPLRYQPHDFRRIFVTDAIMSGLPPHIAQIIVGHKNISTTMGYKAVYPTEAIEAHHAFIARRRTLRPGIRHRLRPRTRLLIRTSPDGLAGADRSRVAQSSGQQSRRQRALGVSRRQLRSACSPFNRRPETGGECSTWMTRSHSFGRPSICCRRTQRQRTARRSGMCARTSGARSGRWCSAFSSRSGMSIPRPLTSGNYSPRPLGR
ncbi:tyrosine-type recombinase/integrase [Streptomyces sp. NPDC058457]|uniref:tyrosine-type recombinase/integrase n=1 Tax=Streptomyces sp. NPDC058457 TaxID=3346507 RepID=UPI00364EAA78